MSDTGDVSLTRQSPVATPSSGVTYQAAQPVPTAAVPSQLASASIANVVTVAVAPSLRTQVAPGTATARQVSITNIGLSRVYVVANTQTAPNGIPIAVNDTWSVFTSEAIYLSTLATSTPGTVAVTG